MNHVQTTTVAVQVFEPEPGRLYTVESAAYLAGVSRRAFLVYCRSGLFEASPDPENGALQFDDEAIAIVRRAEQLRQQHRMDVSGVRLVFDLLREVEVLREELRFLRGV